MTKWKIVADLAWEMLQKQLNNNVYVNIYHKHNCIIYYFQKCHNEVLRSLYIENFYSNNM
jgi:hypothetical protein